ncbi:MAG: methionyl-tRNA formyltransferase [Saprospiraceae bacterium]|nr:methionyl-tRNA formyltransferase [Saprospiraceae bacterium]MBK9631858.1 methionyl-tRNA formyltransferase [Saprospiraceae bacterium]
MRIVFFGTPDFAVASLEEISKYFEIVAVVTAPDKVGGRGHKLIESAVKIWAKTQNYRIFQPKNLKSERFQQNLKQLNPDLFVVVAFRMMPVSLWGIPPLGTINLHGSLLPKYRGAAPIQRAIQHGEQFTGLTTFLIKAEIDTGDLLLQQEIQIDPNESFGELYDKMKKLGGHLLVKTIQALESGEIVPISQSDELSSSAPKITHEDLMIDWNRSVIEIHNQIRAFSPSPGTITQHEGQLYKIFKALPVLENHKSNPGEWKIEKPKNLFIFGKDGYIQVLEIQPASKRKMSVEEFLNGLKN